MERTSFSRFTLCPDHSIVQFNYALSDRQAQPKSVHLAGKSSIYAVEMVKDTLQMFFRDTYTIVSYADF